MRREEEEDNAYHIQSNHTAVYATTPISAYHRVLKCQKMATETNTRKLKLLTEKDRKPNLTVGCLWIATQGALKGSLGGGMPPRPSNPDPV